MTNIGASHTRSYYALANTLFHCLNYPCCVFWGSKFAIGHLTQIQFMFPKMCLTHACLRDLFNTIISNILQLPTLWS